MLSRREFLNFSAATIALTSLPNQIQSNQLIRNYKLTAEITPHIFDKKGVLDSLWLYNKQTPGPVIEAKENDIIRVEFVNNLDEASTIHWHGIKLEGQKDWMSRLPDGLMPAPPHDETGHTWHHSDKYLFMITKYGIEDIIGQKYPNNMPAYKDILSDKEIISVLSYIKSTWPNKVKKIHDQINDR